MTANPASGSVPGPGTAGAGWVSDVTGAMAAIPARYSSGAYTSPICPAKRAAWPPCE